MSKFLHNLIHGLSKREKAYFKRFSIIHSKRQDKYYLQLFDAMLAMDTFDKDKLSEIFRDAPFGNRISPQLAYLNDQLLKSLSIYYLESSPKSSLLKLILFLDILIEKGFRKQSSKILRKAKKLALEQEDFNICLKLIELEEDVLFKQGVLKFASKLEELKVEKSKIYTNIQVLGELRLLREKIRDHFYTHGFESSFPEYGDFFEHQTLQLPSKKLCLRAREHWYYNTAIKHYYNFNFGDALDNCVLCLNMMEAHPSIFSKGRMLPILSNVLMLSAMCLEVDVFEESIKNLKELEVDASIDNRYVYYIETVRYLEFFYQLDDKVSTAKNISKYHDFVFTNYQEMEIVQANYCLLLFVRANIDCFQFEEAAKWLNLWKNNGVLHYSFVYFRFFSFIIYLELGWDELLMYEVKSTYKALKQHNQFNEFARSFVNYINKYLKKPENEKTYLLEFLKRATSFKSQKETEKNFLYFSYERWCEQRLLRI